MSRTQPSICLQETNEGCTTHHVTMPRDSPLGTAPGIVMRVDVWKTYELRPVLPGSSNSFLWPQADIYRIIAPANEQEHGFRTGSTAECRLEFL